MEVTRTVRTPSSAHLAMVAPAHTSSLGWAKTAMRVKGSFAMKTFVLCSSVWFQTTRRYRLSNAFERLSPPFPFLVGLLGAADQPQRFLPEQHARGAPETYFHQALPQLIFKGGA